MSLLVIISNNHVCELCASIRPSRELEAAVAAACFARHERQRLLLWRQAPRAAAPNSTLQARRAQHSARSVSATRARRALCSPVRAAAAAALPAPCCARSTRAAAAARSPAERRARARSSRAPSRWEGRARTRRASRLLAARAYGRRARFALRSQCRARECLLSHIFGGRPLEQQQQQRARITHLLLVRGSELRGRSFERHAFASAAASRALSASGSVLVKLSSTLDEENVATACVDSSCSAAARSVAVCIVSYGTVTILNDEKCVLRNRPYYFIMLRIGITVLVIMLLCLLTY